METRYSDSLIRIKGYDKLYKTLKLRISNYHNRIIKNNLVYQRVRKVVPYRTERIYLINTERNNEISDKWNQIYKLGNGVIIQS